MNETVQMRDGDCILVIVKDGKVIYWTWNMALPHVEFVRRTTGTRPDSQVTPKPYLGARDKLFPTKCHEA